jgi:hypothetical protein
MWSNILQTGLAAALVIGISGATVIAQQNKEFRPQYGRIVENLVSGILGAVAGGGAVYTALKRPDPRLPTDQSTDK